MCAVAVRVPVRRNNASLFDKSVHLEMTVIFKCNFQVDRLVKWTGVISP